MAKKKAFRGIDSDVENFLSHTEEQAPDQEQAPAKEAEPETLELVEGAEPPARRGRRPGQTNSAGELETRTDRITLYFTGDVMEKIALIARVQDKSKNKFLTEIIEKELEQERYNKMYKAMRAVQQSF